MYVNHCNRLFKRCILIDKISSEPVADSNGSTHSINKVCNRHPIYEGRTRRAFLDNKVLFKPRYNKVNY